MFNGLIYLLIYSICSFNRYLIFHKSKPKKIIITKYHKDYWLENVCFYFDTEIFSLIYFYSFCKYDIENLVLSV